MCFYNVFVGLLLCVISTASFSHVAGVTDTAMNVNINGINLVYTLPIDNINELTGQQRSQLEKTIIQFFSIENEVDNHIKACSGELISKNKLENIQSEKFHILYVCDEKLTNLSISYVPLFSENENHTNHVRLSIAGRSQSFTYSTSKTTHVLPVNKLLTQWGVALNSNGQLTTSTVSERDQYSYNATGFSELLLQSTHYFSIGIEHILLGYDHVLFLIGLLLLPLHFRSILIIATSFTVAHSITLALSVFEVFTLPVLYVEAMIALSIVYIAIENIVVLKRNSARGSTQRDSPVLWKQRAIITFLFGLLHGFGFSYVLKEIGLGEHVVGSLLFFNLGVELGQLFIIAVFFPILLYVFRKVWGTTVTITLSVLVGLMGLFWLIERVASLV